jgi:hypothetical protein
MMVHGLQYSRKDDSRLYKIWIVTWVLQGVERGLINSRFRVEELYHLCDLTITLKIAPGLTPSVVTSINPVFSFFLTDIKSEIISRTKS